MHNSTIVDALNENRPTYSPVQTEVVEQTISLVAPRSITAQQIVEVLLKHFSRPDAVLGKPFDDDAPSCLYRVNEEATNPGRCAFGVFIPDQVYSPAFEGESISTLVSDVPVLHYLAPHERLLATLQGLHDDPDTKTPLDFVHRLRGFRKALYLLDTYGVEGLTGNTPAPKPLAVDDDLFTSDGNTEDNPF